MTAVALAVCLLCAGTTVTAQMEDEQAVKAAFVLNITKYVEWPQEQRELVIGFLGDALLERLVEGGDAGRARCDRLVHWRNKKPVSARERVLADRFSCISRAPAS